MYILITIGFLLGLAAIAAGVVKALPFATQKRVEGVLQSTWRWCWRNGQELVGLPAALLVFWFSGPLLRWLEPNSAIYDAGVLQGITVVVCHLLVANSVARIGSRINVAWLTGRSGNVAHEDELRPYLFVLYFIGYCVLAAVI